MKHIIAVSSYEQLAYVSQNADCVIQGAKLLACNGNFTATSTVIKPRGLCRGKSPQGDGFGALPRGLITVIYSPFEYTKTDVESFVKRCMLPVYLNLPVIARGKDIELLKSINISNYVINNPYGFELAKGKNIILGTGLNIINNGFSGHRILGLESKTFFESTDIVYAFGRPVVMSFCHKPPPALIDDHGAKFKILRTKLINSYYNMYNNLPINVLPLLKQKKTLGKVGLLYDFTSYDINELKKFKYEDLLDPKYPSTRGHLYRGVE